MLAHTVLCDSRVCTCAAAYYVPVAKNTHLERTWCNFTATKELTEDSANLGKSNDSNPTTRTPWNTREPQGTPRNVKEPEGTPKNSKSTTGDSKEHQRTPGNLREIHDKNSKQNQGTPGNSKERQRTRGNSKELKKHPRELQGTSTKTREP